MQRKKSFWITLSLVNLTVVALLGLTLRTKFLFSMPFIDYRSFLNAHSHFAFAGWVGLALAALMIYNILSKDLSQKRIYQWILWGIQLSAWGMVLTFPFGGYWAASIFFSVFYIIVSYTFGIVFIKDVWKMAISKSIRLLSAVSIISLMLSSLGPIGLSYIMISKSGNSILYRDCIYTFLHFQYNGFFTLAVFALFFNYLSKKGITVSSLLNRFALYLSASVIPALFLSLLWHNSALYYIIAGIGCVFILLALYYFGKFSFGLEGKKLFSFTLGRFFWITASLSFGLKMLMNVGTIIPQLGNAVYGDRPVIIGFLHLVFLAFVSFFIFSFLIEEGYFQKKGRLQVFPFYVFATGVIANEAFLLLQGLEILLQTNNYLYNWLLWGASIVLFVGAFMIMGATYFNKKTIENSMA